MDKIIQIDGKEVGFRANALTPRIYRHKIGRDIIQDINILRKSINKANSLPKDATEEQVKEFQLSILDLEIFENVSYVMAKQYNPDIPNTVEEWLENFSCFFIYEILPEILSLWGLNQKTTAKSKKK